MEILYIGKMEDDHCGARVITKPYSIVLDNEEYLDCFYSKNVYHRGNPERSYNFNMRFENSCLVVKKTNKHVSRITMLLVNSIWSIPSIKDLSSELNADSIFQFYKDGVFIVILCRMNAEEILLLNKYYYDSCYHGEYWLKFI